MKIQLFKNKKGLVYGTDDKRIGCDIEGRLKIGSTEVSINPGTESIMPLLFNGCSGCYKATFTDKNGEVYALENVTVRGGRIVPPPQTVCELMELRCRSETLEEEVAELRKDILVLSRIFDTNSLNFLIK